MSNFEPPPNADFDEFIDPEDDSDPLAPLREQIAQATASAKRYAEEAGEAWGAEVPPAGWATPDEQAARQQELHALIALVEALRDLVPNELKQQVRDIVKQLLLLVRALIDWWVERMDEGAAPRTAGGPSVEEIPID